MAGQQPAYRDGTADAFRKMFPLARLFGVRMQRSVYAY